MKLSVTKENLTKALTAVSRLVGSHTTLPVLANVLIATDGNRLKLSTTNLELGINYWIGAKVSEKGAITVPARLLNDFVANLPEDTVELSLEKTNLKVSTTKFQSVLNGIEAEEFPSIPSLDQEVTLQIPVKDFKEAVAKTVLVASADDTRPVLNGVYIYHEDKNLIFVATDSYRLAEKVLPQAKTPKTPVSMIVPARTLAELARMASDESGTIDVIVGENQAVFKLESVELVSRLIDGQFPDYRQLIPTSVEATAQIETADFNNLAKVSSLFAYANAGSVTVELKNKDQAVQLQSVASQVGENTAEAPAKVDGEDTKIAINSRYLSDGLSVIDSPTTNFVVTGKVNPCLIRPEGDDSYLHLIMPLRS